MADYPSGVVTPWWGSFPPPLLYAVLFFSPHSGLAPASGAVTSCCTKKSVFIGRTFQVSNKKYILHKGEEKENLNLFKIYIITTRQGRTQRQTPLTNFTTWLILKRVGLKSSGQRLNSLIGKTKRIAFFNKKYSENFQIKKNK